MILTKKVFGICIFLICLIVSLPITLATTQNLIYDANGNLITGDGKYRTYDGFNHLVQIRNGNNATGTILENLTWHPLEERILVKATYETNGSWKENVYYFSQTFVKVKNASGTYDYKYIYQNGQLVAQEFIGEKKHFMLNDHKGTVHVVVNESGAKVEETFYSPFGEIISGGATSRFDYEGKEFDSIVGDYDFHARKVNPQWGMFTQPDTMLPNVYDPQQLNRYAFERNNPYKYVDEDGHFPYLLFIAIFTYYLATEWDIIVEFAWESINAVVELYKTNREEKAVESKNIEPAIINDASPADIVNTQEKKIEVQEPNPPKESDENLNNLDNPLKKKLEDEFLIQQDKSEKKEEPKQVPGGSSSSGGGDGSRTSRQIAEEKIRYAKENGGYGVYKEDSNGGYSWWTVTPRKEKEEEE